MQFKAYPSYKHSGVEWLGDVPSDWDVLFFNKIFNVLSGATPSSAEKTYWDGDILWVTNTDFTKNKKYISSTIRTISDLGFANCGVKKIPPFSLLLTTRAGIGAVLINTEALTTNQGCKALVPKNKNILNITYCYYLLLSNSSVFNAFAKGTTFTELATETLKSLSVAIPKKSEQTQIANYLDQETQKIDTLIAKQEKLIELLQEQRKSVISHAVTKGLDPNAPMKDSGVEWLGDVPSHWATPSSKHLLEIPITDGPHETPNFVDDGVPFISAEAISKGKIDFNKKRGYITPELNKIYSRKYFPRIEDIYMVKSGATTGKVAMVETTDEFNIWSPLAVFRCNKNKIFPNFLLSVFNSSHFYDALVLNWSYGTQQNIGMGVLSNIEIPCPPLKEQNEIIEYLDTENLKFDNLISKQQALIEKLKEYRASVISHAVTGKIDVRELVA